MTNAHSVSKAKKKHFIILLVAASLITWGFWQMGEPGRRANTIQQALRPGMSVWEVDSLWSGHCSTRYQVEKNSGWESVSREEFAQAIAMPAPGGPLSTRLYITFMGMAPGRIGLVVHADGVGRITAAETVQGRN